MKLIEVSHSCLNDVLNKQVPFKLAIENICNKNSIIRDDRKNLTNIVGCSLRHFYIFDNILSRAEMSFNDDQKIVLYLYLTNRLFVPLISLKEMDAELVKYEISSEAINKVNALSEQKGKLIPENIPNDSIDYLHYRFNIPTWILKMWMKHFKGYTYKIVKSINVPANHYLLKNSSFNEAELNNQNDIVPSNVEGLYRYQGKVGPLRHPLIRSGKMVLITPAEYYLYSRLDLDVLRKIALYSEVQNNLPLHLEALLSKKYNMDIIAGTSEAYYPTKKDIENRGLNNVDLYQTGHSSIITCLSEKVHTFFVLPANTNFAELRKAPDYFNRVKQDELDAQLSNQKLALHDASEFVEDGGQLIYAVSTMDKKETLQITDDFLKNHPDFSLVEQKQFLPFDKYDSTYYFAIFRKEVKDD